MEYRVNIFFYISIALLPALISIYLWGVVFQGSSQPEKFSQLVTYYLLASFVGFRIASFHWKIMNDIREGRLANFLLRPMSYPATVFWYETGGRTWSTILTIPVYLLVAVLLGSLFKIPNDAINWLLAILAFVIAYVLNFFISFCIGLITVWQNPSEGFLALYEVGSRWLGGVYVPLALMPNPAGEWLQWLPFAYIFSLPVRIFQGLPPEQIWQGILVQLVWISISVVVFRWLWRKAQWRYEGFEG